MTLPMTWLAEDRSRLKGFRAGDPKALAAVYRHYVEQVARALSLGFSFRSGDQFLRFHGYTTPFELDDALQETFARAFAEGARLKYDGLRPYRAYLMTIARNLVIDRFRRATRHPEQLSSEMDGDQVAGEARERPETPEEAAAREQLKALYEGFKESLSDQDRELFELRFERDQTRAHCAVETGLSAMQVRTRESKLRAALYELLLESGHGDVVAAALVILLTSSMVGWPWD